MKRMLILSLYLFVMPCLGNPIPEDIEAPANELDASDWVVIDHTTPSNDDCIVIN